ncbi:MAG: invasion protein CiaB [Candidatus Cloacimonetes bacterium]|nr:invasion protein CiaB [Candidatus Cloacimonadota bacterium]
MKTAVDFLKEVEEVQNILVGLNKKTDSFFELVESKELSSERKTQLAFIDDFLQKLSLEQTNETRLALITRLVSLRDDSLIQVLKKVGRNEDEIRLSREQAYLWVSEFYQEKNAEFLAIIEDRELLSYFYRTALKGMHKIGLKMTNWQPDWTRTIIDGVNQKLSSEFNGDSKKVVSFLSENGLIDKGHHGNPGDRSYSVLVKDGDEWKSKAYCEVFPTHVGAVVQEINTLKDELKDCSDPTFHEKEAWVDYLAALSIAFEEKEVHTLIDRWADVDRKWMGISSPIQPAHPLEYYEDHYRQAVALEWDVRISNPEHSTKGFRKRKLEEMAEKFYLSFGLDNKDFEDTVEFSINKLDSVQLHIGRVGLFYAADYCGLPSAQVVPNDELVSKEYGKKIFAFPDNILQTLRSRPFIRLGKEVYGKEFLKKQREITFKNKALWFQIYDITTIGHEYGHILWTNEDTEAVMNGSGQYKNVEEWKATTGGLVSFFMDTEGEAKDQALCEHILSDVVKRSIGLIAWKETPEVLPYYMESLIHLKGLLDTGVIAFDTEKLDLKIDLSVEKFEAIKQWYFDTYKKLVVDYYLPKNDPQSFLDEFVVKEGKFYESKDKTIQAMSVWYWDLYKKYGREVDISDSRDNYMPFDE